MRPYSVLGVPCCTVIPNSGLGHRGDRILVRVPRSRTPPAPASLAARLLLLVPLIEDEHSACGAAGSQALRHGLLRHLHRCDSRLEEGTRTP